MFKRFEERLLLIGLPVWLFGLHHAVAGDGELRFLDLLHVFAGEPTEAPYSMVGPLMSAPLVLLGRALGGLEGARAAASVFNVVLVSLAGWLLYATGPSPRAARSNTDPDFHRVFLLLMTLTMLPKHLQGYYGEVVSAVCAYVGIVLVFERARPSGWALLALAGANTPALLVPVTLLAACDFAWKRSLVSWHDRGRLGIVAAAGAWALWAMENVLRWGSLTSGYTVGHVGHPMAQPFQTSVIPSTLEVWFGFPAGIGLWAILFSPGKGLMWFAPSLWLAVFPTWDDGRRMVMTWIGMRPVWSGTPIHVASWRDVRWALLVFLGGMLLLYSPWCVWHGDWYWGPRYFLFGSFVASWYLARELTSNQWANPDVLVWNRLGVSALLCASAYVAACGAVLNVQGMELCQTKGMGFLCWYVPDYSALYRPLAAGDRPLTPGDWTVVAYIGVVLVWALGRTWLPHYPRRGR
jgi:hypothetical protein